MLVLVLKTAASLYVVVVPMFEISDKIDWYSWLAAVSCEELRVPFEASVASVTARLSRFVTCERAPSATVNRPTPSWALVFDCERATEFACNPFTRERPAASSAPELIFDPEDNWFNTFDRLLLVLLRLFSAYIALRLFNTPRDIAFSLLDALIYSSPPRVTHNSLDPGLLLSGRSRRIWPLFRRGTYGLYPLDFVFSFDSLMSNFASLLHQFANLLTFSFTRR